MGSSFHSRVGGGGGGAMTGSALSPHVLTLMDSIATTTCQRLIGEGRFVGAKQFYQMVRTLKLPSSLNQASFTNLENYSLHQNVAYMIKLT